MTAAPVLDHAAAFLAAVCADPRDDSPRLMYADWLQERGDPLGEFIRLQCELATMKPAEWCVREGDNYCRRFGKIDCRRCTLRRRERELLWEYGAPWVPEAGTAVSAAGIHIRARGDPVVEYYLGVEYRRGFVEGITLGVDDFLRHAGALARAAPLTRVTLAGAQCWGQPPQHCWFPRSAYPPDEGRDHRPDEIPDEIYARLPLGLAFGPEAGIRRYASDEAALAALSAACVEYARAAAGLPALG